MHIYDMIELVINGLIMVTGFSAIIIYKTQQRYSRQTAATMVVTQIDNIENNLKKLKDSDTIDEILLFKTNQILEHNYWNDSRHLLLRYLGTNNVRILDDFYSRVEEIEKSRKIIFDEMSKTWEYKELVYQFNLAKELSQKENFDVDTSWLINFKKHGSSFSASLPKDYLCKNINYINYVSGTVAYDILRKMSYC